MARKEIGRKINRMKGRWKCRGEVKHKGKKETYDCEP
jgi:hypothetical protein